MTGVQILLAISGFPILLMVIGLLMSLVERDFRHGAKCIVIGFVLIIAVGLGSGNEDDEYAATDLEAEALVYVQSQSSARINVVYEDGTTSPVINASLIEYSQGDSRPVLTRSTRHSSLFGIPLGDTPVYGLRVYVGCPSHVERYSDENKEGVATVFEEAEKEETPPKAEFPERGL